MSVVLTGGSGLVGRAIMDLLHQQGETVHLFSRNPSRLQGKVDPADTKLFAWNPLDEPAPKAALDGARGVIHLAGENVGAGRWTKARKQSILQSRVLGTRNLVSGLAACDQGPPVLVSASAVGFYGDAGETRLDEQSPAGQGFLADVCRAWEEEAQQAEGEGCRVHRLRLGMVLSPKGGALARMLPAFRLGLGGPLGSGKQWMPWISLGDAARLFCFALDHPQSPDVLLGVAPEAIRQKEFAQQVGRALGRPAVIPAPRFVLRAMFGEMADLFLQSQRVEPRATVESGFHYENKELEPLLQGWFL